MRFIKTIAIAVIFVVLWQNCTSNKTYKIELKSNVKIITNFEPLYRDKNIFKLELHQVISGLDDNDIVLNQPIDLVKDTKGNIYIFDMGDVDIKKYDSNGNFIATFGRSGNGPGEFQTFSFLEIDNEDNIYINNMDGRLQVITNEGEYIREHKLSASSIPFILVNKEKIIINKISHEMDDKKAAMLHSIDYNGKINKFNRLNFIKDNDNHIIVAYLHQNKIEKYKQNGKLVFQSKRTLDYSVIKSEQVLN